MNQFEIYNYRTWINLTDEDVLIPRIEKILKASGYTIINFVEHKFSPEGYTCVWLLAESHFAVHTFPQDGRSYLELSGCVKSMNEKFVAHVESFKKEITTTTL
ncbi:MAG: S-adenosylmethionine decarboxylase [Flavobacteriales bacterium]|nr:S-adenosylmethionine decarboxylase [Flavobacteriales bacterium]